MVSGICSNGLCFFSQHVSIPAYSNRYLRSDQIGMIKSPWVPDVVPRYNSKLLFFTIDPLDTIIPHTLGNLKLELACVASVSVWFRSKERPRNGILGFGRARNETRAKKMKVGGGGREGRKRLQTNPSILKTCVRQRTQRLIGSASRTMSTCVDQRFVSY